MKVNLEICSSGYFHPIATAACSLTLAHNNRLFQTNNGFRPWWPDGGWGGCGGDKGPG